MKKNNENTVKVLEAIRENTLNMYRKDGSDLKDFDKGYINGLQLAIWLIQDKNYFHDMTELFELND